jgi:hypothetical protein
MQKIPRRNRREGVWLSADSRKGGWMIRFPRTSSGCNSCYKQGGFKTAMKKLFLVNVVVLFAVSFAMAQGNGNAYAPTSDILGAHQNNGRGCAGCHQPHSGARGSGQSTTAADSGDVALWGQDVAVLYGQVFQFGDKPAPGRGIGFKETLPSSMVGGISDAETGGLLMCLSCHDGSLTAVNMMANQSYEQKIGVLPSVYGSQPIPTLLGAEGSGGTKGDYYNDHPVGREAQIGADAVGCTTGCSGLVFDPAASSGKGGLTVTTGSQYATFIANYGWPALAPGRWSNPYGVATNAAGVKGAFVVCTTCHDQHVMNVYAASTASPIAGSAAGTYRTFFFIRGPYNVTANTGFANGGMASSTTQFCRQCHFGESNEANGGSIPTLF